MKSFASAVRSMPLHFLANTKCCLSSANIDAEQTNLEQIRIDHTTTTS